MVLGGMMLCTEDRVYSTAEKSDSSEPADEGGRRRP